MSVEADIDAIRRALALGASEESLVRRAAPLLVGEIEGWVEGFYARLAVDPVAMSLLQDPATVLRLKRSLIAWFQELLSLPYDASYERARAEIGRVHVRIGMPQHLMVTAMSGIHSDVRESVRTKFADDARTAQDVADALDKVLDLELALMLGAYRRRARELAQQADRAIYAGRAEGRVARGRTDAADAASCYAALIRRETEPAAVQRWAARLSETLRDVVRDPGPAGSPERVLREGPRSAVIAELCAKALEDVSFPARTDVEVIVDPSDARALVHETPLRAAIGELVQNAVNRDPGGSVRLALTALADGGLLVEVHSGGPRWPEGVRSVEQAVAATAGMSTAYAEMVTELHGGSLDLARPPGGGAGIRMRLRGIEAEKAS